MITMRYLVRPETETVLPHIHFSELFIPFYLLCVFILGFYHYPPLPSLTMGLFLLPSTVSIVSPGNLPSPTPFTRGKLLIAAGKTASLSSFYSAVEAELSCQ